MAAVIRELRWHQAHALFVENITDRRSIERIAQETGARVGGTLYSDALALTGQGPDSLPADGAQHRHARRGASAQAVVEQLAR